MLELKNVTKYYGKDVLAVDNLSSTIEKDEFLVLLGPSGCGKSTLLKMIAGLETISSGSLYIDGVLSNQIESYNRDIAMVFQDYSLYPHMSVYDNLAFPLKMRKIKKRIISQTVDDTARVLSISDILHKKPRNLSGGQQQRVAIGRALVRRPKIFLFDEPLSNLYITLRDKMRNEFIELHNKIGSIFVYVTHDQAEAMMMGDRIVVMDNGKIQQVGTPNEIYFNPQILFVANFIGTPKINIFECADFVKLLSRNAITEYNKYEGTTVAIRPEDIQITEKQLQGTVEGEIVQIMPTGKDTIIYVVVQDVPFRTIVKADTNLSFKKGQLIFCSIQTNKAMFFNKATEIRCEYGGRESV